MKMLVKILIGIVVLVALPFIAALFIKKEYAIQREIEINKPQQEVFNYVKYLRNQEKFSKWVMQDPGMKKDFRGTDGQPGFVYAWDSQMKDAGKGEQEIKNLVDGRKVEIEVRFEKPFKGVANTPFEVEAISPEKSKVIWGMSGQYSYPMNIMTLFVDKLLGKDLEQSLATLKSNLEK
jgi:uncharacterized membrane protein